MPKLSNQKTIKYKLQKSKAVDWLIPPFLVGLIRVVYRMYSRQGAYFQQEEPRLGNQYLEDSALQALVKRLVPPEVLAKFESDLIKFGDRVSPSGDILYHGRESEDNPPKLVHFNAYGRYALINGRFKLVFWLSNGTNLIKITFYRSNI